MDLADGLETGSPCLHLHSSDLALSRGSPRCGPSPFLRKSQLLQQALPRQRMHCNVLGFIDESFISDHVTGLGVWLHLILRN